ncbi:hypothetical protein CCH79_00015702 [Gambusia affinis]|uniref:Uncharacterized protein n=1 Tax=Gambusia affinis TaxID=33528 RepID=A0A315W3S5_GAMAF|nr:hypothetical protein CCH79_00015702 [Gambusia affinis]
MGGASLCGPAHPVLAARCTEWVCEH